MAQDQEAKKMREKRPTEGQARRVERETHRSQVGNGEGRARRWEVGDTYEMSHTGNKEVCTRDHEPGRRCLLRKDALETTGWTPSPGPHRGACPRKCACTGRSGRGEEAAREAPSETGSAQPADGLLTGRDDAGSSPPGEALRHSARRRHDPRQNRAMNCLVSGWGVNPR